jgi:hypothetical protein
VAANLEAVGHVTPGRGVAATEVLRRREEAGTWFFVIIIDENIKRHGRNSRTARSRRCVRAVVAVKTNPEAYTDAAAEAGYAYGAGAGIDVGAIVGAPAQLTNLVGRDQELADLTRLLGRTRLVTLSGPGGVGKTRLSLAVADELGETFADGAVFVDPSRECHDEGHGRGEELGDGASKNPPG